MFELITLKGLDYNKLSSKEFSDLICSYLKKGQIQKEVFVPNRGDGRSGRIDLVYRIDNKIIAFELDRLSPRRKSIFKLKEFNADESYIITRSPFLITPINTNV